MVSGSVYGDWQTLLNLVVLPLDYGSALSDVLGCNLSSPAIGQGKHGFSIETLGDVCPRLNVLRLGEK